MKYLLILTLVASFSANAIVPITQGQPSPITGYGMTVDEEKQIRQINEEKIKLSDLAVHQNEKIEILEERTKSYAEYVQQQKTLGTWSKVGLFAAGSAATVVLLYLATSVVKSAGK